MKDTLQRPLQDLRISVIDQCNLRCAYCMPVDHCHEQYSFLRKEERLHFDEIVRLVNIFVRQGVAKVRITGGEPLLRENITELIEKISAVKGVRDLALTTNGILLPRFARMLKNAGLKRLTVSLDTLDDKIFRALNGGRAGVAQIIDGIRAAEAAGFISIKINVVVKKGINDHCLLDLVNYFKGTRHIVRFIEYMDAGNRNDWQKDLVVPSAQILSRIREHFSVRNIEPNYYGEVADRYQLTNHKGEIGFISSVSQPFCQDCTRLRLSPDGKLYTCLFAGEGKDLRTLLRNGATDEAIYLVTENLWKNRTDRYSQERSTGGGAKGILKKVEMYQIGG
ncbi:MAG TPA: GTP 3',8-cyclase MoaA [Candidatus Omnitrophota bacterium]|nr:GTP 3',8-cyclase MoaA [Candidatus Omnitrophota bacterium]HPD85371.1 GTP 3',8-cyclase MoaA [Candidatus Omnitrophota bacterium]HRZ04128.1 GTP 3',8-cyclase MoaA [Candidatus Omnitrophota bacterium]